MKDDFRPKRLRPQAIAPPVPNIVGKLVTPSLFVGVLAGAGGAFLFVALVAGVWYGAGKVNWPSREPAPIAAKGLMVMFVEESKVTPDWLATLLGDKELREYLDEKCVKDSDGHPMWQTFDPDRNTKHDAPVWQKALADHKGIAPGYVVSNGKKGTKGPLTKETTAKALIDVFQRYEVAP